jgi:hypothetical protein
MWQQTRGKHGQGLWRWGALSAKFGEVIKIKIDTGGASSVFN